MSYYSKSKNNFLDDNFLIYQTSPELGKAAQFLEKVHMVIRRHLDDEEFRSIDLSKEMGVSRSQLFRKIKTYTGFSTALYIRHVRLKKSLELLKASTLSIRIVAYMVGFRDLAYFSRCFKQTFGRSPSQFRSETLQMMN